ncbi:SBBP repeat-containing protein, partial [Synechococcus sp. UW140]|uniref:SBBP repeat-containing protein n=1 Tax=Synechococcus sp. UW140 TaxID=368503 RepID=UPI003137718B
MLGSSSSDGAYSVTTGSDGSIYIAGSTEGNLDGNSNAGNGDAFLSKFNSDGTKSWTRLLGTSASDYAQSVTTGTHGSVYITGRTSGNLDGNSNAGGNGDAFLSKYNSDGTKSWTRLLGTSTWDYAQSVTTGSDGSVYITGRTDGNLDGNSNAGSADAFLSKYNSDGTKSWTRLIGTSKWDHAQSVTTGSDGSIYIAGETYGNLDGNSNAGGNEDAFLSKYNSDGTKSWTRLLGSSARDWAYEVTKGSDGSIYIAGSTTGSLDGNSNAGGDLDGDAFLSKFSFPPYTLTTSATTINEGAVLTNTVATTNVTTGTKLYYSLSGTGITTADFSAGALTGEGTIDATGKFTFAHTLANDLTTEGAETLAIKLFSDEARTTQVGSTASVSISDTSVTAIPTYTLTPSAAAINEGAVLTSTVTTTNVATGTKLYYALSGTGITSADFSSGALTGEGITDATGKFSFSHTLANDLTTEGAESLSIKLYSDSARTLQVGTTATVSVVDSSTTPAPTYTLTPSATTINEGAVLTSSVTTTNLATGTKLYYALSGTGITAADFSAGALTGEGITDAAGKFTFTHTLANDLTTEGAESLSIKLYSDSARTLQVGTTATVSVVDSSTTPAPTYTLTPSATTINEGAVLTSSVTTTNLATGTKLYYALSGTGITTADFSAGALTGEGTTDATGKFSFTHTLANDLTTEGAETLNIKLYSDVARTLQVGTTATVGVVDTSLTPIIPVPPSSISVIATANGKETDGSPVVFTFTRTGSTSAALSVNYQLFGTAQAGSDYIGNTTGTVSFAAGSSTATLSLPALADGALIDPYETIIARINPGANYGITPGNQFATATITAEGMVVIPKGVTYPGRGSEGPANRYAFAVLKSDGSVISWGRSDHGGIAPAGLTGVIQIFTSAGFFAALKSDGNVVSWGSDGAGAKAPAGLTGVIQIFSTNAAFAALKTDGSVVSWGSGSAANPQASLTGVSQIFSTSGAFAALKSDGSVVCWGESRYGGSAPAGLTGVSQIFSAEEAFAALKTDGSVIAWGDSGYGGTAPTGLTGVSQIFSNKFAFAALKTDGSVVCWGNQYAGGSAPAGLIGISQIFSAGEAFAALKSDGSVVCWGNNSNGGTAPAGLTGVIHVISTSQAFAALKTDGSVIAWGDSSYGGTAPTGLTGVSQIFSNEYAVAALKTDGSVVSWGRSDYGGSAPAGLTSVVGFANPYTDDRLGITAIPTYTLTPSATTINEGAVLTSTVTTTNVTTGTKLYYSLSGTGITTADFSAGALTGEGITDATGKFTFTHTLANDLTTEGAESLSIKLYSDVARTLQVGATASVSIVDTSVTPPPQVSVIATANGKETDGSPVVFTFTRAGSTSAALSVNYQLFGTAQAGSDYTGNTSSSVSFAAGSATATLSLPALADGALIDPYETIIARINPGANYEIATGKQFATATITAEGMVVVPKRQQLERTSSGEFRNFYAFAALRSDGSVISWGDSKYGGSAPAGLRGVSQIFSNYDSLLALKSDGSVISWGNNSAPTGLTGVSQIFSTGYAFAALKTDGSVIAWGNGSWGGSAPTGLTGVSQIFSNEYAFAALKSDGSVISWGDSSSGGSGSAPAGLTGVSQIFSTRGAFAALKSDGSVTSWGYKDYGGSAPAGLTGVSQIFSNFYAFTALKSDGSVISWGESGYGGSAPTGLKGVSQIFSNFYAFTALKSDGSVISWGNKDLGGSAPAGLTGVSQIFSADSAFAALKSDGSVISWGNSKYGGSAPAGLTGVIQIFSNEYAFAALRSDGSVISWGDSKYGGSAPAGLTGVNQIFSTRAAFAALKSDGSVISWGKSDYDGSDITTPAGLTGVVGFANPYTDDRLILEDKPTPTYILTPSTTSINEGATLITSIATTDVASGTTLYYSLSGIGITTSDFSAGALTGEGITDATGKFSFTHTLANDLTSEGTESLSIKLYSDSARTLQVGTTATVSVVDSSTTAPLVVRGNSLYTIVDGPSWTQAEANSVKLGGNLVTINDAFEQDFIQSKILTNSDMLIGITDVEQEGSWKWVSGQQTSYTNWQVGEPNNRGDEDYGLVNFNWAWRWNDVPVLADGRQRGITETPFIRRGDSAYVIVSGPNWEEAEANAVKLGGHLVTINDAAENEWISRTFADTNKGYEPYPNNPQPINGDIYWNGLHKDAGGTWKWASGEVFTFSKWGPNRPNQVWGFTNEAVEMILEAYPEWYKTNPGTEWSASAGNWSNAPANITRYGIAEIKLAPNNTPTGTPTVTGTFKVGSTLTIDATAIKDSDNFTGYTPTFKYNWETSTDGTTWSKLTTTDGADNNNTYILTAAESSKKIRGVVSYLDGYGTNEVVNSAASDLIADVTATPMRFEITNGDVQFMWWYWHRSTWQSTWNAPSLNLGTDVSIDETLIFTTSGWLIGDPGANSTASRVNAAGIILSGQHAGKYNLWTISNPDGTLASPDDPVAPYGALLIGNPDIGWREIYDLSSKNGAGLSAPPTDLTIRKSIRDLFGKTLPVGTKLFIVYCDQDDGNISTYKLTINSTSSVNPNIAPTGIPTVTGTLKVGSTLTIDATAIKDSDNFTGYTPTFKYNWESSTDGTTWSKLTTTDGADNNNTYILTAAEATKKIRGVVSYLDGYGTQESVASTASSLITSSAPPVQSLTLNPPSKTAIRSGVNTTSAISYTVSTGEINLTGVGASLYFDSTQLSISIAGDPFKIGLLGNAITADTSNADGDPKTDKVLSLSYLDFGGNFPGSGTTLPLLLANLNLVPTNTFLGSTLHLKGDPAVGFTATGADLLIALNAAPVVDGSIPALSTNRYTPFSYTLKSDLFSDSDSTLSFSATTNTGDTLPSWLTFNPTTRTLSGTPTTGGSINLNLSAADELGSISTPLSLKIKEVQSLSSSTTPIRYQRNKELTVPINYSTSDGSSTTGLSFKVHFNSSLLSFDSTTGITNKAQADLFQIGATQQDTANTDNDATTDSFIPINIASFTA